MNLRNLRLRLAALTEGYIWLWRASHAHTASPFRGTLRFLRSAAADLLLLGVWTASVPLRQPVQRHRVVVPALAGLFVMTLILGTGDGPRRAPFGEGPVSQQVGAACGGGVTLGAIASPGDELVAFEACANAITTLQAECDACRTEAPRPGRFVPELRLGDSST